MAYTAAFDNDASLPLQSPTDVDTTFVKPVDTADRIQTIDMVRGFALLGILMMNITGFGIDGSVFRTIITGPHNTADYWTLNIVGIMFEGTMRGLFSMLFGAGMILFTLNKKDSANGPTVTEYYYRRLGWLLLFGLFNAYVLLWQGDILYYYAIAGMLLYPFRNIGAKWLIILGFVCAAVNSYKTASWYGETREHRAGYLAAAAAEKKSEKPTAEQEEHRGAWQGFEQNGKPDTARTNENIRNMRGGYGKVFSHLLPQNAGNETWGGYHGVWDSLTMMFVGMGLFLLGFFSNRLSTATYVKTLLIGYGLGIPISLWYVGGFESWMTNITTYVDTYRQPHWHLYDIRRMLLAIGHASVLMLVFRSGVLRWLMKALANVGQMAFTNYLSQSIICSLFFFGYGLGYYNKLSMHQLYYVVFAVWVFQLIVSPIWLRYFRFGPFEWLWRSLTYWKRQPMRK